MSDLPVWGWEGDEEDDNATRRPVATNLSQLEQQDGEEDEEFEDDTEQQQQTEDAFDENVCSTHQYLQDGQQVTGSPPSTSFFPGADSSSLDVYNSQQQVQRYGASGLPYSFSVNISDIELQVKSFWKDVHLKLNDVRVDDFRLCELPLARIKKIIKLDDNVRMISAEVPIIVSKAADFFIQELTMRAWANTTCGKRRTLQRSDICAAAGQNEQFDFLIDILPRDELLLNSALMGNQPDAFHLTEEHYSTCTAMAERSGLRQFESSRSLKRSDLNSSKTAYAGRSSITYRKGGDADETVEAMNNGESGEDNDEPIDADDDSESSSNEDSDEYNSESSSELDEDCEEEDGGAGSQQSSIAESPYGAPTTAMIPQFVTAPNQAFCLTSSSNDDQFAITKSDNYYTQIGDPQQFMYNNIPGAATNPYQLMTDPSTTTVRNLPTGLVSNSLASSPAFYIMNTTADGQIMLSNPSTIADPSQLIQLTQEQLEQIVSLASSPSAAVGGGNCSQTTYQS